MRDFSINLQKYIEKGTNSVMLQPYKERDMVAAAERLGAESRMSSGQEGPYSSPRAANGSSAGSCGTPAPRTPASPRPGSQPCSEGEEEDGGGRCAQYLARWLSSH